MRKENKIGSSVETKQGREGVRQHTQPSGTNRWDGASHTEIAAEFVAIDIGREVADKDRSSTCKRRREARTQGS